MYQPEKRTTKDPDKNLKAQDDLHAPGQMKTDPGKKSDSPELHTSHLKELSKLTPPRAPQRPLTERIWNRAVLGFNDFYEFHTLLLRPFGCPAWSDIKKSNDKFTAELIANPASRESLLLHLKRNGLFAAFIFSGKSAVFTAFSAAFAHQALTVGGAFEGFRFCAGLALALGLIAHGLKGLCRDKSGA